MDIWIFFKYWLLSGSYITKRIHLFPGELRTCLTFDLSFKKFSYLLSNTDGNEKVPAGSVGFMPMAAVPPMMFHLPPELQSKQLDWYWHYNPGSELFSRKVFIGGLPIDVDESTVVSKILPLKNV